MSVALDELSDELADLLGFTLVLAKRWVVGLVPALERKWHMQLMSGDQ